jgi:hypothetical protein
LTDSRPISEKLLPKFGRIVERTFQLVAATLALLFLGSGILFLWNGHVTETIWDMWHLYGLGLTQPFFRAAIEKYGNHSIFFPSVVWLIDIRFFHNNQQLLFIFGLILLVAAALLLITAAWQDQTITRTAKLIATLLIIAAVFWMNKAWITSIGPFSCICGLAVVGAFVSFHALACMRNRTVSRWRPAVLLVAFGLVSSFSYGSGFAVWPTLLCLGWSARLPLRYLTTITLVGCIAAVIYKMLPGAAPNILPENAISIGTGLRRLCSLIGAPCFYAATAWSSAKIPSEASLSSPIHIVCGAIGITLAAVGSVPRLLRRDLSPSKLQLIALGVVIFNLVAIAFIVVGRTAQMHISPGEVLAPRYTFWSSLFWGGLALLWIRHIDAHEWLRWPSFLLLLALPIVIFPDHYQRAAWARYMHLLSDSAATSLINGVHDDEAAQFLSRYPERVYRVAPLLRARRLDMFASRVHEWIGKKSSQVFIANDKATSIQANCYIDAYLKCDDGEPAARITGSFLKAHGEAPRIFVILDPSQRICGIARGFSTSNLLNRFFYGNKFPRNRITGYIRAYNAALTYMVHTADNGELSTAGAIVQTPAKETH